MRTFEEFINEGKTINGPAFSMRDKKAGDTVEVEGKKVKIVELLAWVKNAEAAVMSFICDDDGKQRKVKYDEGKDGYVFVGESVVEVVNEAVSDDDLTIYKVYCRDPEGSLKKLIEYIGQNGNTGHSFSIVVDPDMTEEEGRRTFGWDGDGSDYIKKVEIIQKEK